MKTILLITLCILIFACDNPNQDKTESFSSELSKENKDTLPLKTNLPNTRKHDNVNCSLYINNIAINNMKIDSTNEYGGGDCWGNIKLYSNDSIRLGLDSMNCGDYGYHYTQYYFNNNYSLQKISRLELETIFNTEIKKNSYKLTETVFNFKTKTIKTRTDTTFDSSISALKSSFSTKKIEPILKVKNKWILEYQSLWVMKQLEN